MVVILSSISDTKGRMVGMTPCDVELPSTTRGPPNEPALSSTVNDQPSSILDSLPLEILQEIFTLCLPDDYRETKANGVVVAPLRLCHVSQGWRRAAINEPRLWRNLKLPTARLERASTLELFVSAVAKLTAKTAFWIDNAGEAGIRLVFEVPRPTFALQDGHGAFVFPHPAPTDIELMNAWRKFVASVLIQRSSRIRSLEIRPMKKAPNSAYSTCIAPFVSPDLPQDFKRLQSVFIVGSQLPLTSPLTYPGCTSYRLFPNAPNLRKVALSFTSTTAASPSTVLPDSFLPWRQLTHVKIKMPCSGSFWKRALVQCTQLEACVMHLEHCIVEGDQDPPGISGSGSSGIVLDHLIHLDVTFHDEFTSAYFDDLRFPVLGTLKLACDIGSGFPTFVWLPNSTGHLHSQFQYLTSLTLSYQNISSPELLDLLRETEELEELVVDSYLLDHQEFLRALTLHPQPSSSVDGRCNGVRKRPLLPKLQAFTLFLEYYAETPPTNFEEEDFWLMLASRSPIAMFIARHVCIMNSYEVEGIYTSQGGNRSNPNTYHITMDQASIHSTNNAKSRTFLMDGMEVAHLRSVELWADNNEESARFQMLEKFQRAVENAHEYLVEEGLKDADIMSMDPSDGGRFARLSGPLASKETMGQLDRTTPEFSFVLDFNSPSEWLVQGNEPVWYTH